jgi:(p)ppGpp synthase/HD superfamily hydrolase
MTLLAIFMNMVETAKSIAQRAHAGQYRRDGVTPYINHPEAVAERLKDDPPEVVSTAWLHDVIEDTEETWKTLTDAGMPPEVVAAVETLTKTRGVPYREYLSSVKQNPIARKVKVADMLANLSDSPTERQIVKYVKGLLFLANGAFTDPETTHESK